MVKGKGGDSLGDHEPNSAGPPTVALAPNLGVALAECDQQPLYLRIFFDFCTVGCTRAS
jgi:hypothetical protein